MPRPPLPRDGQGNIIRTPEQQERLKLSEARRIAKRNAKKGTPLPDGSVVVAGPLAEVLKDDPELAKQVPPLLVNGMPNPDYFRWGRAFLEKEAWNGFLGRDQNSQKVKDMAAYLDRHAEVHGFDPKVLADIRSPEEKALASAKMLAETPAKVLELTTDLIDALEAAMDKADTLVAEYADKFIRDKEGEATTISKWRSLLPRVRRLQERARTRVPKYDREILNTYPRQQYEFALSAAHPIRFMLYVGRSNITERAGTPASAVFKIAKHHAKMICDYWIARTGSRVGLPRKDHKHEDPNKVTYNPGEAPYIGAIIVCPLRFGKTELFLHNETLEQCENPRTQEYFIHAVDEQAEANLGYVKRCFDLGEDVGRRREALYPGIRLDRKDNDCSHLRLRVQPAPKQPNITACGVMGSVLSANADKVYSDDAVPQKDADQPTERERRYLRMEGTFFSRLQGKIGQQFRLIVGTLWHYDDATMRYIKQAIKCNETNGREGLFMMVSIQRCGGPKDGFKSLWPDMYDAPYLRSKYYGMGPSLYSAAYMSNPLADEKRMVRKLRFYNPNAVEHKEFLKGCTRRLSIDPSGTRHQKSDKAGVVYLGQGNVVNRAVSASGVEVTMEQRIRLLDATELNANQVDIVQYALGFADPESGRPVDYLHVESRSGYNATGDIFEHYHGVPADRIIRYDPKNLQKGERLKSVSTLIDDSNAASGIRAVMEFPCECDDDGDPILEEGGMRIDPRFQWIAEQILDFGVCPADHALDSVVQVLIDQMPELKPGTGELTEMIRRGEVVQGDKRIIAMLDEVNKKEQDRDASGEQGDYRWLTGR